MRPAPQGDGGALTAFRRIVLLHGCVRSWLWVAADERADPVLIAAAVIASVAFGWVWARTGRLAPRVALIALALQLVATFPLTDNHFFLELYAVGLLSLVDRSGASEREVVRSLRWLVAIVLLQTGLQKLLYGQYFSGQFLAFMIGQGDRFAVPFEWIVSAEEVDRLRGYDALRTGAGPFRVESLAFVAISNLVWIAEIGLAGLLAFVRTRRPAAVVAMALVVTIQLAARELGFALLFVNLLLLFTVKGNERALPWFVAAYAWAIGVALGWLPGAATFGAGSL